MVCILVVSLGTQNPAAELTGNGDILEKAERHMPLQVMVPTGFKGPGACGELDSNGEHWVDRDLRLRHVGRSAEQRIFHGKLPNLTI